MSDSTVAKPLSGAEIADAITYDVRQMFKLDDRFHPHVAYDGFSYTATFKVTLPSGVQQEVERTVTGPSTIITFEPEQEADLMVSRNLQAPNDVRYETEQPIPTLVENGKGQIEEKFVSYKGKDRAGRPLGHKQTPDSPPTTEKVRRNVVKGVELA